MLQRTTLEHVNYDDAMQKRNEKCGISPGEAFPLIIFQSLDR